MAVEINGNGKQTNKAGYYKHKETGRVVEVGETPEYGSPMADAFVQAGYEFIGNEAPAAEVSPEADTKKEKTLSQMNKAELVSLATSMNVAVSVDQKNDDIRKAIKEAKKNA